MGDTFAECVKAALDDSGRTQIWLGAEIARLEGFDTPISQPQVARYMSGQVQPEPARVFTIERALGVPAGSLSRSLGYVPADLVPVTSVPDAIAGDLGLTQTQREDLTAVWEGMRKRTRARRAR